MQINDDLSQPALHHSEEMAWVASPMAGVMRRMLERDGDDGAKRATSVVRYAANGRFSPHSHRGGEEFIVLDGVFSDENGDYPAGSYIRNPPGSHHAPFSNEGTTIFVKLQQFAPDDSEQKAIDTALGDWQAGPGEGVSELPLHSFGTERVSLLRLAPGARLEAGVAAGGEEIFVLDGSLDGGGENCPRGTWWRLPPGPVPARQSREGCLLYLKQGHLG